MKRKFAIWGFIVLFALAGLPVASYAAGSGPNSSNDIISETHPGPWSQRRGRVYQRRGKSRRGSYKGYKNYGQYRRTRVGNRRYRLVRRPYYRNGRRYVRVIRVYY